jgi:GDP-4-dehydro-6-deoxy-D-mannose reductase
MEEDHPLRPRNPYALSKALTDLAGGSYADAFGLHVVRIRAFNHAGPGQSDFYVVSSFARQIAAAEAAAAERVEVVTGNIRTRRDFTDVRDVVRAYWMALDDCDPGAFNVCSGRATATGDILAALALETKLDVVQRTNPELVREGEVMEIRGSHDRFTEQTGWTPEIPLEQTLRDTLGWWRERLPAGARA